MIKASANKALGNANGQSTTYNNTHVSGKDVVIDSSGDTNLKGAVVSGQQVTANVGGKLTVESLQDTATYDEKQKSAGAGVSLCVPPLCVGQTAVVNVSASKQNINSNYQSVGEQSAIKAGDGGFTVNVKGDTNLKGGAITSTQAAIDNNKNTFNTGGKLTTSDIQNSASFDAKSVSVSVSSAGGGAAGYGNASGQASSTTQAAISGIAGNTAARTGDKEAGIKPIFDAQKVKQDVQTQTAVTAEFGRNATKAVGDYAATKLAEAQKNNDQAGIAAWSEGGSARLALHTLVGGLSGGVAGAAGAATSQAAIDQIGQAIKNTDLPVELKQALVAAAGTAIGTAVGGTAGAATGFNATVNNYLTHAQLQSKQQQLAACKDDACRKQVNSAWDKVSQASNVRVEDKVLQASVDENLKTMKQLTSDMTGVAQYKAELEEQLRASNDPTQKASLQLQINEADTSMRQIAALGKTTALLMYEQTGEPKYQSVFQALSAATSGNELGAALAMPGGGGGNINKAVQEAKSGAQQAQTAQINGLADEAKAANAALNKAIGSPADSTYVAPTHASDKDFQTHGLTTEQVPANIRNQLTQDLQATFGAGAGAEKMAKELINSGSSIPVPMQATTDTKLYKLVSESSAFGPKPDSPYFIDGAQLQRIQQNPSLANDILGLPSGSQGTGFRVYEVQPQPNATPTIYQSNVATTTNSTGPTAAGNATQTLVPDRSQWTQPKLTNIRIGGQ